MRLWLFIVFMMAGTNAFSQLSTYDILTDPDHSLIYIGTFKFEDLDNEKTFDWYDKGLKAYHPNREDLVYLQKYLPDYNIDIVMGTWCEDSQVMIPQLYQVLDVANYPMTQYTMHGVDRNKKGKNSEELKYKVALVPTIILSRDGKEIGRIVESPKKSIEADMAAIIKSDRNG